MSEPTPPRPELRRLERALQEASDAQIAQVLGVVDRLESRGAADALIAPVRDRLGRLCVPRPLRFARLLFAPVEPLLMPAREWSRGSLGVPRSVLSPLAEQVREGVGDLAREVEAMIEGGLVRDQALLQRAGAVLWPAAARLLDQPPAAPPDWHERTGLGPGDHAAICGCLASVLSEAVWLAGTIRAHAEGEGVAEADLRAWLEAASARHPEPPGALLAVLLARLPEAAALLGPLPSQQAPLPGGIEPAVQFVLGRLDKSARQHDLAQAGAAVRRAAAVLDALQGSGAAQRPSRKAVLETLRRRLDAECVARYAEDLMEAVLAPAGRAPDPAELAELEEPARWLRLFEIAGRRLGSSQAYDELVREAARQLRLGSPCSRVERARLVEILAGPEAARPLLEG